MKRVKAVHLVLSLVMVLALILSSCKATPPEEAVPEEEASKYGGTLRVAATAESVNIDPNRHISPPDDWLTAACYDPLVWRMHDESLAPALATSWEPSDDLMSWTFHLRKGVKFHHGKEFNADDVVFTIERLIEPDAPTKAVLGTVVRAVKIDDYRVRIDCSAPNGFLPETLSFKWGRIVPSDVDPALLSNNEFGTGAFIVEERLPLERAVLKRNPDYWMKDAEGNSLPYLDEVIIFYMTEPETRIEAVKTGAVDLVGDVEPTVVKMLEASPRIEISEMGTSSYVALVMDQSVPPFDNKLVRQAVQAAIDRALVLQVAYFGHGVVGNDIPIPPFSQYYDATQRIPPYDTEKARSLLKQAGYEDSLELTLHTSTAMPGMVETAVAIKESIAPAGIRINIQQDPEDVYWSNVWLVEPFYVTWWSGRMADEAVSWMYPSDAAWNESKISNPQVDALIVKARGETLKDRKATYGELQRILIDDASRIIPCFNTHIVAMRDNVRGVSAHASTWLLLQEAWLTD